MLNFNRRVNRGLDGFRIGSIILGSLQCRGGGSRCLLFYLYCNFELLHLQSLQTSFGVKDQDIAGDKDSFADDIHPHHPWNSEITNICCNFCHDLWYHPHISDCRVLSGSR